MLNSLPVLNKLQSEHVIEMTRKKLRSQSVKLTTTPSNINIITSTNTAYSMLLICNLDPNPKKLWPFYIMLSRGKVAHIAMEREITKIGHLKFSQLSQSKLL